MDGIMVPKICNAADCIGKSDLQKKNMKEFLFYSHCIMLVQAKIY